VERRARSAKPQRALGARRSALGAPRLARLFFAGLIHEPSKGFHILEEACRLLWQRRRDFELVVTAEPAGAVGPFTRFVGWLSQEQLPGQLYDADIVAFPTVAQEGLGRTAVEAMAAGRPVVASRIGGLTVTVQDGVTGLLCAPGDAADLAKKIEMLLDDSPPIRARSFSRLASSSRSSASIQKIHLPVACRKHSFRAAAKLSAQGESNTFAPKLAEISRVRSVEPVSTTIISPAIPATDARQSPMFASSFFAMMQMLTVSKGSGVRGQESGSGVRGQGSGGGQG
jgi:hypothetical protein